MNRIDQLFTEKKKGILNMYCTAGYPQLDDTLPVMKALQYDGADMLEVGMPFSDPLADGPIIQQSSKQALENGMSLKLLFHQLKDLRKDIQVPVVLMGYLNPVLQYGMEAFVAQCSEIGVDGVILPDLPMQEYEENYRNLFEKAGIHFIFLITPETAEARIRKIDSLSNGFIYLVSSSSTTGADKIITERETYFKRIKEMKLQNPTLVGFGIKTKADADFLGQYANGVIIASAYIKALGESNDAEKTTREFLQPFKGNL